MEHESACVGVMKHLLHYSGNVRIYSNFLRTLLSSFYEETDRSTCDAKLQI